MIPNGLPALVTICLAFGTTHMAEHNAIIKQLPCVETLGSLTVICSDKTGTLTKNEMTLVSLKTSQHLYEVTGVGYEPTGAFMLDGKEIEDEGLDSIKAILTGCMLCNDSNLDYDGKSTFTPVGAPTEVALITAGLKAGLTIEEVQNAAPRVKSVPFESEHKFMGTVHCPSKPGGKRVMYVKGAPDRVLPMCSTQLASDSLSDIANMRGEAINNVYWLKAQEKLSSKGLRVLGLAMGEIDDSEDLSELGADALRKR
jgi:magnesium-transporting ATPase (P-type)